MNLLRYIDRLVDGVTMYMLLIYYLVGLLLAAVGLSLFKDLHYNPVYIIISTLILVSACWIINKVFANIFEAPSNRESSIITGLILALIIAPNPTGFGITFLLAASGLAIASKYLLTWHNKHIFNPAAIAIVLTAFGPRQSASWWVGTSVMLPFVLVGGILIMRKIRRERMVLSFFASAAVATTVYSLIGHTNVMTSFHNMLLSSSLFFLGFVMLTEPLTSPPTAEKQTWYGILVGVLLPPQVHFFKFYSSPELALLAGNIFSYIISPKVKLFPTLKEKYKVAANTLDFVFTPDRKLAYEPGQYLEWTLPHANQDIRGNRRYFTLASSPTEPDVRIGVKFYDNGSSYKHAMLDLDENSMVAASQLAGDFVMPKDPSRKLVFIAGGIGVTPFRSMVKYMIDTKQSRTVTLLYSARSEQDFAYRDVFEQARNEFGLNTLYVVSNAQTKATMPRTISGMITADTIKQTVPDYLERVFYISGTHPMVVAMQDALHGLGVNKHNIKVDFFPGYA